MSFHGGITVTKDRLNGCRSRKNVGIRFQVKIIRSAIPVSRSAPRLIEWGIEGFLSLIGVVGWVEIVAVALIEELPPKDFTN